MYGREIRGTEAELRSGSVSLRLYNSMCLLNKGSRDAIGSAILPWTQFFIILLPASCNYVVIRYHDQVSIVIILCLGSLSLTCMAICTLAYPVAASIHTLSSAYLTAFKKSHVAPTLTHLQKKKIKSLRPLKIQVGGLTFIRPFTVLKLINSIIYWTMRTLLIYR